MKLQIALEFTIIFTLVLIVFIVLLALISNERALGLSNQEYLQLQLTAQSIASQINNAVAEGNGYSVLFPLSGTIGQIAYSVNITKSGLIILKAHAGSQILQAYAYSNARNIVSNPSFMSGNAYMISLANGTLSIQNVQGTVCIDYNCPSTAAQAAYITLSTYKQQLSSNAIIAAKVTNQAGKPLTNVLVGFVTSLGTFANGKAMFTNYTNANGIALASLSSTTNGIATVKATAFNGNLSTQANVVAFYPSNFNMGNVLYDLSGTGNNGAMSDASWSNPNYIAHFGGNSYVYANVGAYVGGDNMLSASAWVYINQSTNGPIVGITDSPPGSSWNMPFLSADGFTVYGWIWGVNGNNPLSFTLSSPGWYFLAITYNPSGSGSEDFYVNGMLVATGSGEYSPSGSQDYWTTYISGAKPSGVNSYLTGKISNVQIYNTQLTSSEVQALYEGGISAPPILPANVIGWWPLNGNANDYSGNGNNGVIYGNVSFQKQSITPTGVNASSILAASFNGANSYIEQNNGFAFMNNAAQPFTISIWVYPKAQSGVIVDELGQQTPNTGWHDSWIELVNGNVYIRVWDLSCVNLGSIPINTWSNIVMVGSVSGTTLTYSGYINGVFRSSGSGGRSVPGGSSLMYYPLGVADGTNCGSGGYFNGEMADYQFYNTSLSANEIQALYQEGISGTPINTKNLVAWWPLNGNANDYSGNGYNGTANNVVYAAQQVAPPTLLNSLGGAGLNFNGAGSYINLGGANSITNPANPLTIVLWFKTTKDGVLIWNGNTQQVSSSSSYSPILYVNTNGDLAGGDWTGSQPFSTSYYVADGSWHFVAITQTASQQTLYLDGKEIATFSGTPQSFSPFYWTVGEGYTNGWSYTNNGNFYFNGSISSIQIYNTALTPSQILQLYEAGMPPSATTQIDMP